MGNKELQVGNLGHILTQGDVNLKYQKDQFTWNTQLNASWEPKSIDYTHISTELVPQTPADENVVYKTTKSQPLEIALRTEFGWKPSARANYTAWIYYRYFNYKERNVTNSLSPIWTQGPQDASLEQANCSYLGVRLHNNTIAAGAEASWKLGEKSLLQGSFSASTMKRRKQLVWSIFETVGTNWADIESVDVDAAFRQGNGWMYRITPDSTSVNMTADIHLRRTLRDDDVKFSWTPGLQAFAVHSLEKRVGASLADIDPSGAYVWKDSLRLKQTINYWDIYVEPYVAAEYSNGKIEVGARYGFQFQYRRLQDETGRLPLLSRGPYPSGGAHFSWIINDNHKLSIIHETGVHYPYYLQLCWFDRTGGYADQLFRGNSDLLPTLNSSYGFSYELRHKRFRYSVTNAVIRERDELDQTWYREVIDGRPYKMFVWVNSADCWSFGITHRIGWDGEVFKAGIGADYKQTRRTSKADGAVMDNHEWSVTAEAGADLGKGWGAVARVRYQSDMYTWNTTLTDFWDLDARIHKQFKNFLVYLDMLDLPDCGRTITYRSTDGREIWQEFLRKNRRMFCLGFKWTF